MLAVELPGRREKRKNTEDVHGCSEGGDADGWCNRRGGKMEADNRLWQPLKVAACLTARFKKILLDARVRGREAKN